MQEIGIESSVLWEILSNKKTIEGRLGKEKFLKLRVGEELSLREDIWTDGKITGSVPDQAAIRVTQILYFESFIEMFESLDFTSIIPSAETPEAALAVYRKYYSQAEEDKFGVVAILFDLT